VGVSCHPLLLLLLLLLLGQAVVGIRGRWLGMAQQQQLTMQVPAAVMGLETRAP
jgi:hypothetical protein